MIAAHELPSPYPSADPTPTNLVAWETTMNLVLWLPAMFLLGLATLALLFAFLAGCDKV
jgi:hypothetical protein